MVAGIAGMLLGTPVTDALGWDGPGRHGSVIVVNTRPDFIFLSKPGFHVSYNGPYDIIFYGNRYFLFRDGAWYRASNHRGPWVIVRNNQLPSKIRRYRWDDLRRYRESEYRRHDHKYWNNRFEHDRRMYNGYGPQGGPVNPPPPPPPSTGPGGYPGPGGPGPGGNPGPGGPGPR